MTPKEQETLLAELEARVDRLRVLYDQYFLGFEKLEPTVPRKDVERRFAVLRKENIRNTALRFRFNVITQKYNTYSMYWTRICRQIEEGTFKRHLRKAKKILEQGLGRDDRDLDLSIDVDMGDFEDVDALLAEAEASVARYEKTASDMAPPPPSDGPRGDQAGAARPYRPATPNPLFSPTTGASFLVTNRQREVLGEPPPSSKPLSVPLGPTGASTGLAASPLRGGAPKKLIRKKDGTVGPAASSPKQGAPSSPAPAPAPPPAVAKAPASSGRVALPPMPASSPRPQPMSAPRVAAASPPPADRSPPADRAPPSQPTPPPRSSPRIPAGPQSSPRVALPPMPPRSSPGPAAAPGAPAAAASGRLPAAAAPPPSRPSVGRVALSPPPSSARVPLPPKPEDKEPREARPRPPLPSERGKKSEG